MYKSISMELRNLMNMIRRKAHKIVDNNGECGTEMHGFIIGYVLDNKDRDIYQRDFEEEFKLRKSTISRMLSLMEKNGLIKRVSVGEDARLKKIVLTDKALLQHKKVMESINIIDTQIIDGISHEDLQTFIEVLSRMQHNLEE